MASDPPLKNATEAIHQGDQDRYDYEMFDRRSPRPWEVAEVGNGEPLPELIQPRTIGEVIEQKGAYQKQASILNKEIQKVRQGQPSKIVYKSKNQRLGGEGYIVDPAFMETLTSARQAWDLQSGDGIEGREFYNEAIPSLGSLGALMPPSWRNENWHFNMGDGQGLDWHIKNRQFRKKPGTNPDMPEGKLYPELLEPVDFSKVEFPSHNLQGAMEVNAAPEHWLDTVGPQGNKPQGMDQLGDSQLIDMMRNRKPDYFNRWNESRRKPGRWGPATEPIMPETISPEQWADIADKYGGSWFGQPMYGPEGTGNIMAQHLRDQMMIK